MCRKSGTILTDSSGGSDRLLVYGDIGLVMLLLQHSNIQIHSLLSSKRLPTSLQDLYKQPTRAHWGRYKYLQNGSIFMTRRLQLSYKHKTHYLVNFAKIFIS